MEFKNILKNLRAEKNISQGELAKQIGTSRSSVANWEQGQNFPNNEVLMQIADYFNCSTDYLLGRTFYKKPKEYIENQLYELDLTEPEFNELQSLLLEPDNNNLEIILQCGNKLSLACDKCLEIIEDYTDNNFDPITQYFDENALNSLTEIIKTLDKSKIIHNYQNNTNSEKFYMCPVYGRISAGQPNWAEECIEGRIPIDPDMMDIVNPEEHFFLKVNGESMNKVVRNGAYALIHKQEIVENGEIAVVLVNGDEATLKKFSKQGDVVVLEPMSDDSSFHVQIYDKTTPIQIIGKYVGKFEMNK